MHHLVDVSQQSLYQALTRAVSKLIVIQVRAGYAAEDLGTPLPDDPVKPAQLCRALQFHDVGGRPVERPGEIKVELNLEPHL